MHLLFNRQQIFLKLKLPTVNPHIILLYNLSQNLSLDLLENRNLKMEPKQHNFFNIKGVSNLIVWLQCTWSKVVYL